MQNVRKNCVDRVFSKSYNESNRGKLDHTMKLTYFDLDIPCPSETVT